MILSGSLSLGDKLGTGSLTLQAYNFEVPVEWPTELVRLLHMLQRRGVPPLDPPTVRAVLDDTAPYLGDHPEVTDAGE